MGQRRSSAPRIFDSPSWSRASRWKSIPVTPPRGQGYRLSTYPRGPGLRGGRPPAEPPGHHLSPRFTLHAKGVEVEGHQKHRRGTLEPFDSSSGSLHHRFETSAVVDDAVAAALKEVPEVPSNLINLADRRLCSQRDSRTSHTDHRQRIYRSLAALVRGR